MNRWLGRWKFLSRIGGYFVFVCVNSEKVDINNENKKKCYVDSETQPRWIYDTLQRRRSSFRTDGLFSDIFDQGDIVCVLFSSLLRVFSFFTSYVEIGALFQPLISFHSSLISFCFSCLYTDVAVCVNRATFSFVCWNRLSLRTREKCCFFFIFCQRALVVRVALALDGKQLLGEARS